MPFSYGFVVTDGQPGADGASAYQIAVANGFVGTEQEWLTSLKADGSFRHDQETAAAVWVVTHDLGYRPNVTTFDTDGDIIVGAISHASELYLTIQFTAPVAGYALCS